MSELPDVIWIDASPRIHAATRHLIEHSSLSGCAAITDHLTVEPAYAIGMFSTGELMLWEAVASINGCGNKTDLYGLCNYLDERNVRALLGALGQLFGLELAVSS